MTGVLVLADNADNIAGRTPVGRPTCALLTVARRLGAPAVALGTPSVASRTPAVASGGSASTTLLGRFGAETIYQVAAPELDDHPVAARVEMLVELARRTSPAAILIASGRDGLEIAGRVAVRLDSGVLTDVIDVKPGSDGPTAVQSVQGGSYLVESRVARGVPILVVRTERVTAVPAPTIPSVTSINLSFPSSVYAVRTVSRRSPQPELSTAAVVVAGGRGMGSRAAFEGLVHGLAAALGGVAGGSHTATELGWCPREAQVGQLGTIVHPSLYLALGVSGSQRHRSGMRGAATVVAIDCDPSAAVFHMADLGVVGDVHQVVPELLAEIERRRAQPIVSTRDVSEV
jgi:electron transfer flavoprotein alpha subunit